MRKRRSRRTELKLDTMPCEQVFVAADGDRVGLLMNRAAHANDPERAKRTSESIKLAVQNVARQIRLAQGRIYVAGGDDILGLVPLASLSEALIARWQGLFFKHADRTLSLGVGKSPRTATQALQIAKGYASGGHAVLKWGARWQVITRFVTKRPRKRPIGAE